MVCTSKRRDGISGLELPKDFYDQVGAISEEKSVATSSIVTSYWTSDEEIELKKKQEQVKNNIDAIQKTQEMAAVT